MKVGAPIKVSSIETKAKECETYSFSRETSMMSTYILINILSKQIAGGGADKDHLVPIFIYLLDENSVYALSWL
jgi:hypothetical protein